MSNKDCVFNNFELRTQNIVALVSEVEALESGASKGFNRSPLGDYIW